MTNLHAILLGFVQGITEFLPISSSAHLILTSKLLNWADQGILFDIAVHFGTLIAVIIYFYKDVIKIIKGKVDILLFKKSENAELTKKLIVATLPIVFLGFIFKDLIENNIRDSIIIIAISSIFWGILLYLADKKEEILTENNKISYKVALFMGIAQAFAIIPGTSRSGSTMTIARFLKFSRKSSASFSMLMSIPVILLMAIVKLFEIFQNNQIDNIDYSFLSAGVLSSFFFAIISIHFLIKVVSKVGFLPFVIYRIALGLYLFYIIL